MEKQEEKIIGFYKQAEKYTHSLQSSSSCNKVLILPLRPEDQFRSY